MKTVLKTVVLSCLALLSQGRSLSGEKPASLTRLRENLQEKVDDLMAVARRSAVEARPTTRPTSTTSTKAAR